MRIKSRHTAVAPERPAPRGPKPLVHQQAHRGQADPGPEHPEDSELEQIGTRRDGKDDWLWAYPDPTRPPDYDLLTVEELLERRA